jgi:hypothetical protein
LRRLILRWLIERMPAGSFRGLWLWLLIQTGLPLRRRGSIPISRRIRSRPDRGFGRGARSVHRLVPRLFSFLVPRLRLGLQLRLNLHDLKLLALEGQKLFVVFL